ncbi:MAG TPA: hypothetical protein PKC76_16520 [Saprospiraceae bacterium]|nr:hypothetical protein [Saprospiraceae bacterium]HMP25738.1 hypothetical protein [Saprospiraceae bacterium]
MKYLTLLLIIIGLSACNNAQKEARELQKYLEQHSDHHDHEGHDHGGSTAFWGALQQLCGKAYAGTVVAAPENDTTFANKDLVMHLRACADEEIRIPFFVGDDRSRTWVLRLMGERIQLKHDHRHEDGSPDAITMYGGIASNSGSDQLQIFPADQYTLDLLPGAAASVWWIELSPGEHFTYNLRRLGTERFFSVRFDLTQEVPEPAAPWGTE